MLQRVIGPVLAAAGVLILAASLLANVIGRFPIGRALGIGSDPGFGSQQTMGTILGAAVLLLGIWLWRQRAEAKYATLRYTIAALVIVALIGGPMFVVANRSLRKSADVGTCVEVESVPSSAGDSGPRLVRYGVRIANTGKSRVYVDSVVLMALRDSAASPPAQSGVVAVTDVLWEQVDSVTVSPIPPAWWSVGTGRVNRYMQSIIVPAEELSPLYRFRGFVFFRHRDPSRPIVRSRVGWIDNFPRECS